MIIDKWDADEKARDSRTYDTKENSLEGLNNILKKNFYSKKGKQIPSKSILTYNNHLYQKTMDFTKKFIFRNKFKNCFYTIKQNNI